MPLYEQLLEQLPKTRQDVVTEINNFNAPAIQKSQDLGINISGLVTEENLQKTKRDEKNTELNNLDTDLKKALNINENAILPPDEIIINEQNTKINTLQEEIAQLTSADAITARKLKIATHNGNLAKLQKLKDTKAELEVVNKSIETSSEKIKKLKEEKGALDASIPILRDAIEEKETQLSALSIADPQLAQNLKNIHAQTEKVFADQAADEALKKLKELHQQELLLATNNRIKFAALQRLLENENPRNSVITNTSTDFKVPTEAQLKEFENKIRTDNVKGLKYKPAAGRNPDQIQIEGYFNTASNKQTYRKAVEYAGILGWTSFSITTDNRGKRHELAKEALRLNFNHVDLNAPESDTVGKRFQTIFNIKSKLKPVDEKLAEMVDDHGTPKPKVKIKLESEYTQLYKALGEKGVKDSKELQMLLLETLDPQQVLHIAADLKVDEKKALLTQYAEVIPNLDVAQKKEILKAITNVDDQYFLLDKITNPSTRLQMLRGLDNDSFANLIKKETDRTKQDALLEEWKIILRSKSTTDYTDCLEKLRNAEIDVQLRKNLLQKLINSYDTEPRDASVGSFLASLKNRVVNLFTDEKTKKTELQNTVSKLFYEEEDLQGITVPGSMADAYILALGDRAQRPVAGPAPAA